VRTTIRLAGAAGAALIALAATACTSGGGGTAGQATSAATSTATGAPGRTAGTGAPSTAAAGPRVSVSPANGAAGADPAAGVTVTAARGTLKSVTVTVNGSAPADSGSTSLEVPGAFNSSGTQWRSSGWALGVSTGYSVKTVASYNGTTKTTTSTFRTLTPGATFQANIFEGYGQDYGVGMPVLLTFSSPVTNRAAVERAITLTTSRPVTGAWYWDSPTSLAFRPRDYWPANTTVSFTGHFDGVEGAPGVYGFHTLRQTFRIGQSVIAVASTRTHYTQVYVGGKLAYNWPISTGKPGDDTPSGSYLTIDKGNPVEMKGPGYDLQVPWSVRFTWSGDYYHDAYWSTSVQGAANVSHGCVNLSPARAQTYYKLAVPGDPVTVAGSPRAGTWDNGWTYWFLTWSQLLAGSATHQAVQAGPDGSTLVSPSALPADHAKAPLQAAASGAWGTGPAA
jgi:lipoprotein-anchoring transpeptidase ErfK/SrfK